MTQGKQTGEAPVLVWYRDDLRVSDHAALTAAVATGAPVVALYIHDTTASLRPLGGAAQWFLHGSLTALGQSLSAIGGRLDVVHGAADTLLPQIVQALGAQQVMWSRRIDAPARDQDASLKTRLQELGVKVTSFDGLLLHQPWKLTTKTGGFFKVFTPFWRALQADVAIDAPLPAPTHIQAATWPDTAPPRVPLDALNLLPTKPDWAGGLRAEWTPGEAGAQARLARFLDTAAAAYGEERDRPDRPSTSKLSPHLRFGEISPRQIWQATKHRAARMPKEAKSLDKFLSEIAWREFAYHLLYHNPRLASANYNPRFDQFDWGTADPKLIAAWQRGQTGYPIVDAGMRELYTTGFMHNRVRMIVASFLVKHLMVDWRVGEAWFWDTLCDADPANNAASWQWVAGSGADAAPYFRIFNPMLQGEKFDPEGAYVRHHVPELAALPAGQIHAPWLAKPPVLHAARVTLGRSYPHPIVDHAAARARALAAFAAMNGTSSTSDA